MSVVHAHGWKRVQVVIHSSPPNGVIINQSPRPRLLVRGFNDDPGLVERLLKLAPTSLAISGFGEVREGEWDILVTDKSLYLTGQYVVSRPVASHLCVVFVAPVNASSFTIENRSEWNGSFIARNGHISRELIRVRDLSERVANLVHEQFEPIMKVRETHQFFYRQVPTHIGQSQPRGSSLPSLKAFISTADGKILAGSYRRGETSEVWLLPSDTPDIVPWVRAALAEWHELAPSRFPGVPDWSHTADWMTPTEHRLDSELRALAEERAKALEAFGARETALRSQFEDARVAADNYERALLTTQHGELVAVVIKALTELGFTVADADATAAPREHLEDLRIEDPDAAGWIALGEVKGYTKGAKTEALTQFLRFTMRYYQEVGAEPSALWYIVNQFLARDPSTRQPALHGQDGDVAAFAQSNGLVIDTVVLFKLLAQVRSGALEKVEARKVLRDSTGRFEI